MSDATPQLDKLVTEELASLLDESLKKLRHCVEQLSDEQIWLRPSPSMNSVGNLLLHISGNLHQWAVCGVAQTADDRDRDSEFAASGGSSGDELLALVDSTIQEATELFLHLNAEQLAEPRSIQGFDVTVLGALCHTVTHFVGHTHQVIQLPRLMLGDDYAFQWTPAAPRNAVPI